MKKIAGGILIGAALAIGMVWAVCPPCMALFAMSILFIGYP